MAKKIPPRFITKLIKIFRGGGTVAIKTVIKTEIVLAAERNIMCQQALIEKEKDNLKLIFAEGGLKIKIDF